MVINSQGFNGSAGNISLVHFFMSPSNNKQQTPPFEEKLMDPSSLSASYSTRDHSSLEVLSLPAQLSKFLLFLREKKKR